MPHKRPSSSAAAVASDCTLVPVYTPSSVSKSLPQVSMVVRPATDGVHRHQTEWPPLLPPWSGSPVCFVAPTVDPVAVTLPAASVAAAAKLSFAGTPVGRPIGRPIGRVDANASPMHVGRTKTATARAIHCVAHAMTDPPTHARPGSRCVVPPSSPPARTYVVIGPSALRNDRGATAEWTDVAQGRGVARVDGGVRIPRGRVRQLELADGFERAPERTVRVADTRRQGHAESRVSRHRVDVLDDELPPRPR